MNILCLDLEGVLIPEIWQAVATHTGIEELQATTRDIPVYDELMRFRLDVMARHEVPLATIEAVIATLEPLPGATEFLASVRPRLQIAILSDTFYEFAMPMMAKLGFPFLLCHRLVVEDGKIVGYTLRQENPKGSAVRALQGLNYHVVAAGDSYNDVPMLEAADRGLFFCAPANVLADHPQYEAVDSYEALDALV